MEYFIINYGLSGGFGGSDTYYVIKSPNIETAISQAYQESCEMYDNYDGMHGLSSIEDIMEEDESMTYDDALVQHEEERESWLDYGAEPYTKEREDYLKDRYHYENVFEEETSKI